METQLITIEEIEEIKDYLEDKENPKYKNFADDLLFIIAHRLGVLKKN